MFFAWLNQPSSSAACGVVGRALISPVCSAVEISVEGSGTGLNPADFQISIVSVSPAQENSLSFLSSSGTATGERVKNLTQPPSTQARSMNPFASSAAAIVGPTWASTASYSA